MFLKTCVLLHQKQGEIFRDDSLATERCEGTYQRAQLPRPLAQTGGQQHKQHCPTKQAVLLPVLSVPHSLKHSDADFAPSLHTTMTLAVFMLMTAAAVARRQTPSCRARLSVSTSLSRKAHFNSLN